MLCMYVCVQVFKRRPPALASTTAAAAAAPTPSSLAQMAAQQRVITIRSLVKDQDSMLLPQQQANAASTSQLSQVC
jgi:hypothetical protein